MLEQWMPEVLKVRWFDVAGWQWIGFLVVAGAAWLTSSVVSSLIAGGALRIARRTEVDWDDQLVDAARQPGRALLAAIIGRGFVSFLQLDPPARAVTDAVVRTVVFGALTWLAFRLVAFFAQQVEATAAADASEPGNARAVRTQVQVLRRIANVIVAVVGGSLVLMQFDVVRNVGASILASAGVAGVVFGFAAQRSLSTLLAGLQISLTQPIRIGDVVIIENEWGTIEEITLTYVVVRIWDERRLVVPITRFLESSFQNWTRRSTQILGTVFLHADYAVPVDKIRVELERFVKGHPLWDGRVCGLVVTEAGERTITLRALVSSADASRNFDLRCLVREHLIAYLKGLEGGAYLPRTRVESPERDLVPARTVA